MYRLLRKGVDIPVIAGIMPVTNAAQIKRICSISKSALPQRFLRIVDRYGEKPEVMKQAVELINGRAQTECSGNITKENIQKIREIGVDFVSSGALTHSAPILDISMKNLHAV